MTSSDMEELYRNPESFHHEQDMVQWIKKMRPCTKALYIVLFETNSQVGVIYTSQFILYFLLLRYFNHWLY